MPADARRLTGGCLCGAVRYTLAREPQSVSTCHCSMCQKAGGGPFQTYGSIQKNDLNWTKGQPRIAETSRHARRLFCADCGAPLIFHYAGENRWGLIVASLDNGAEYAPTMHEGIESRLPWLRLSDGLPECQTEDDPEFQAAVERASSPS